MDFTSALQISVHPPRRVSGFLLSVLPLLPPFSIVICKGNAIYANTQTVKGLSLFPYMSHSVKERLFFKARAISPMTIDSSALKSLKKVIPVDFLLGFYSLRVTIYVILLLLTHKISWSAYFQCLNCIYRILRIFKMHGIT